MGFGAPYPSRIQVGKHYLTIATIQSQNSGVTMFYNCKIIEYQDSFHIEFYEKGIKRNEEKEIEILTDENIDHIYTDTNGKRSNEQINHCLNVSKNRSKRNLYRIARSNNWEWFITLTFDQKKTDSSNYDLVVSKLKNYLQNLRKRKCPDLKYLIVPEFHKDGKHFHFHGLLSGVNDFIFEDSGHTDFMDNKIYNIINWNKNLGFTTATKIIDNARVTSYIGKYITKDLHIHRVSDAVQPSHSLSSPFPPAPNPSQHQNLFQ